MNLTQEQIEALGSLVETDRVGYYVSYYALTGSKQALQMAYISSFSGFLGEAARIANITAERLEPDKYPAGGVEKFSRNIARAHFAAVKSSFERGKGGHLTDLKSTEAAQAKWAEIGLGKTSPVNLELVVENLAEGNFVEALKHFAAQGSAVAIHAGFQAALTNQFNRTQEFVDGINAGKLSVVTIGDIPVVVDAITGITVGIAPDLARQRTPSVPWGNLAPKMFESKPAAGDKSDLGDDLIHPGIDVIKGSIGQDTILAAIDPSDNLNNPYREIAAAIASSVGDVMFYPEARRRAAKKLARTGSGAIGAEPEPQSSTEAQPSIEAMDWDYIATEVDALAKRIEAEITPPPPGVPDRSAPHSIRLSAEALFQDTGPTGLF